MLKQQVKTMDQGRRELIKGAGALACGMLLLTVRGAKATPDTMQAAITSVVGNAEIGKGRGDTRHSAAG